MCGIAGILALRGGRPPTSEELHAMATRLRHRGPDGEGHWREGSVGLAHARLGIIDLEGGHQPIHNETGNVQVVFNGEIFNYVELRADLERRGHRFSTKTDTEVIVHLYEDHGEHFVDHLNGQFAIALWDAGHRKLVLVRDRVGILPLFHAEAGGRLVFASEVKALLPVLGPPSLDLVALDQLLTFWAPVSPRTLFGGVRELPPGQMLVAQAGRTRTRTYWDWSFPERPEEYWSDPEDVLAERLHDLLVDATRIRLRADVPVGAYLSGGLDSSVLVSLIHHHTDAPLRTFSIGFESESLDERAFQRVMIDHIGSDHSGIECSRADVAAHFVDMVRHAESAVLRTAPTPMMLLSRLVKEQGYKVVMTGEGSDEVLGGYDVFKEAKVRRFWARRPDSRWRPLLLERLYPYLDLSSRGTHRYVREFFGIGLDDPESPLFAHLPRWEMTSKAKAFLSEDVRAHLDGSAMDVMADMVPTAAARWHPFNRGQYVEAKSLMGGYLLSSQGDRMLMANSVEGRFPFLDHRVIEFANRVDPRLKMRVLREKHLLKRATARYLPPAIIQRHKQPYRAPDVAAFVCDGAFTAPYVDELLSDESVRRYGYFDPAKVGMLVKKARRGSLTSVKDNQAFVGVLSTQIWHHLFVERHPLDFSSTHQERSP
jgi:asparagine synthase (glutamine-hydrolysing)